MSVADIFRAEAAKRILITDGAFGTMIQTHRLDEAAYRGDFDLGFDQKGNNDLLVLTRREINADITRPYLDAGTEIAPPNQSQPNTNRKPTHGPTKHPPQ